jgi:hypothetical protein
MRTRVIGSLSLLASCHSYTPAAVSNPAGGPVRVDFTSPRSITVSKPLDHDSLTNVVAVEGFVRSARGDTLVIQPAAVSFSHGRDFLPPSGWEVIVVRDTTARTQVQTFDGRKTTALGGGIGVATLLVAAAVAAALVAGMHEVAQLLLSGSKK